VLLVQAAGAADDFRPADVPRWTKSLDDKQVDRRWYAAYALGQIGAEASPASPRLAATLVDLEEHEYVRATAAWALGRIGQADEAVLAALSESLGSTLPTVRRHAAGALGRIGPKAREASDKLEAALDDADGRVRVAAAWALWRIAREPAAVRALGEQLRAGSGRGAQEAVEPLAAIARIDDDAMAALISALGSPRGDIRRAAARAIGTTGPAALEPLRAVLRADDRQAARHAVESLCWMGPEALDALTEALRHSDAEVRRRAARALGRFGAAAGNATSALVAAVNDPDAEVRREAGAALRKIRAASGEAPDP
jgi:HEAT repeat protein